MRQVWLITIPTFIKTPKMTKVYKEKVKQLSLKKGENYG